MHKESREIRSSRWIDDLLAIESDGNIMEVRIEGDEFNASADVNNASHGVPLQQLAAGESTAVVVFVDILIGAF